MMLRIPWSTNDDWHSRGLIKGSASRDPAYLQRARVSCPCISACTSAVLPRVAWCAAAWRLAAVWCTWRDIATGRGGGGGRARHRIPAAGVVQVEGRDAGGCNLGSDARAPGAEIEDPRHPGARLRAGGDAREPPSPLPPAPLPLPLSRTSRLGPTSLTGRWVRGTPRSGVTVALRAPVTAPPPPAPPRPQATRTASWCTSPPGRTYPPMPRTLSTSVSWWTSSARIPTPSSPWTTWRASSRRCWTAGAGPAPRGVACAGRERKGGGGGGG
jgi:hypothetical protein